MNLSIRDVIYVGVLSALCAIATTILIPLPTGGMVHLGSAALFTISALFGGIYGGLAGAIGSGSHFLAAFGYRLHRRCHLDRYRLLLRLGVRIKQHPCSHHSLAVFVLNQRRWLHRSHLLSTRHPSSVPQHQENGRNQNYNALCVKHCFLLYSLTFRQLF